MSNDLSLAQHHALDLARTLMVPVILFKSGDAFGVLRSDEVDPGDDLEIVHEYDPFQIGPAH
ncbi:hypothetical protein O7A70_31975 [Mesorhizobium sp. Cs1299R1N1]|uniref:hypothetical protein n=1 Tax=Mesorhizobium sp. Cs1299R1N1 TaxID=3015172 RepID=UPI00301BC76C